MSGGQDEVQREIQSDNNRTPPAGTAERRADAWEKIANDLRRMLQVVEVLASEETQTQRTER